MSDATAIAIVTLIMSGLSTMFAAWISLRQKQLEKKVDFVTTTTDAVGKKMEQVTKKTDIVTETVVETKAQVVENMRKLDGRLTLLVSETEKRAYQEGHAAALDEAKRIALTLLESDKAAREKALAEAQVGSPTLDNTAAHIAGEIVLNPVPRTGRDQTGPKLKPDSKKVKE